MQIQLQLKLNTKLSLVLLLGLAHNLLQLTNLHLIIKSSMGMYNFSQPHFWFKIRIRFLRPMILSSVIVNSPLLQTVNAATFEAL